MRADTEAGTITRPDEVDIAPEALYEGARRAAARFDPTAQSSGRAAT